MNDTVKILKVSDLCKEVSVNGERLVILRNINVDIEKGEAVSVIGASGSGKSTLLSILAGLDMPSGGKVYLLGTDIFSLSEDQRAELRGKSIGFVFQSFQLIPSLTALENVMLPLELSGAEGAKEQALNILDRVGLSHRLRHYPKFLSGGEQQRVAVARAFVAKPEIIFADEPTGNLDSATGSQIIDLMFEINREQGTTLVLVTHDAEIAKRSSRTIRLSMGGIG